MRGIEIVIKDITQMRTDAIVNAANSGLRAGSGVCGAIFAAAGHDELQQACDAIGGCPTGGAAITPGFKLAARYVIHAVGPIWDGGDSGEPVQLASCYTRSLDLAAENGCASIAFPLISSGIYGYPKKKAWEVAISACHAWLDSHSDSELRVYFCTRNAEMKQLGDGILNGS